jgi:hypothetical protein
VFNPHDMSNSFNNDEMFVENDEVGRRDPTITVAPGYIRSEMGRMSNSTTPKVPQQFSSSIHTKAKVARTTNRGTGHNEKPKKNNPKVVNDTTDDDDDNAELEVDEHEAFATNLKSPQKNPRLSENLNAIPFPEAKSHDGKMNRKKRAKRNMVKKVPKFFKEDTTQGSNTDEIESAYTELARKLLLEQLDGRASKGQIYSMMTSEHKLRSVIEKKHANKKSQKYMNKYLYKTKTGSSMCNRDKRLSYGGPTSKIKNKFMPDKQLKVDRMSAFGVENSRSKG